jgi:aspartate racemase
MTTMPTQAPTAIGVVGGLGPLASAEFVQRVYQLHRADRDQDMPPLVLLSDPTFPDRTSNLLAGDDEELLKRLCDALAELVRMGASEIVICCVTIHHLLDRVPPELRARVVSLLDVVYEELARRTGPHLLLCTTGTRQLGVFERHPAWTACQDRLVLPDEDDQARVHEVIYRLKAHQRPAEVVPLLNGLMDRRGVSAMIAGCTEFHLVSSEYADGSAGHGYECLDPLDVLARRFAGGATS